MEIKEFQQKIKDIYYLKDSARGALGTFAWLVEETGELSRAIRRGSRDEMLEEFSDALAWLVSLAGLCGIDMEEAAARYSAGCPKCSGSPCSCPEPSGEIC